MSTLGCLIMGLLVVFLVWLWYCLGHNPRPVKRIPPYDPLIQIDPREGWEWYDGMGDDLDESDEWR